MKIIDANLLIYAFTPGAPQHMAPRTWLERIYMEDDLVGIPRLVILAFLRITTNPRVMGVPATTIEAVARIDSLLNHPKTVVVECGSNHWSIFKTVVAQSGVTGPSLTDAHLAALAIEHGSTLCSHDEGFRRYANLKFENPLPVQA